MPLFIKRPVMVEARQFVGTRSSAEYLAEWVNEQGGRAELHQGKHGPHLEIATLEGHMTVSEGDWVIRGTLGEFYPCKPDIFETTYAPA